MSELDAKLTNDGFIARVKANTARWESVANCNKVPSDLKNEFLLRLAAIVAAILGVVGDFAPKAKAFGASRRSEAEPDGNQKETIMNRIQNFLKG